MGKGTRLLRSFGGWRGLFVGLYFMAAFLALLGILFWAAATDLSAGLNAIMDYWDEKDPILGVAAGLLLAALLPAMIYGITTELTDAVGRLTLRVLKKKGWAMDSVEFWSHDSWTWMQLAVAREKKPLTTSEATSWWLCRHEDGPGIAPARAATALGMTSREVRNALGRAARKLGEMD